MATSRGRVSSIVCAQLLMLTLRGQINLCGVEKITSNIVLKQEFVSHLVEGRHVHTHL